MGLKRPRTMILHFLFIFSIVALPLQGLELFPEEVEYIRSNLTVAVGGTVTLPCGSPPPQIFIWGFTKPGTDNNVAVAFNYGHGTKVQSTSSDLGQLIIPEDTSSLQIEDVQAEAQGMFTCQALYDEEQGVRATFYFTNLSVVDEST
ncbi:V-set and immunoglobulin domain-containing protein 10-like 2 [Periophthalmus magnuspinnatus]|uniref:V-set and immunoglobulin domain-containing protein 10-like 2 n=1 Tax=Periophthalmus magnuspinnatus TaxID=409849 RepID=UPI00243744AC|nr:V-set and immunoglobulin domain-containing protein 10-like 2 [Periophthalmus magnuspinnatus]